MVETQRAYPLMTSLGRPIIIYLQHSLMAMTIKSTYKIKNTAVLKVPKGYY